MPKSEFARRDFYDLWFPNLAPSLATMKISLGATTPAQWARFVRLFRTEMAAPAARNDLALLAALSHGTNFSLGCYCEDEARCHRSLLRAHGAQLA